MAAAEEQEQRPQAASPKDENAAHTVNQVSSKSTQKPLGNGVVKAQSELDSGANKENTEKEAATEVETHVEHGVEKKLRGEVSAGSVGADPVAGDGEQDLEAKKAEPFTGEDTSVSMDVDADGHEGENHVKASSEETEQVETVEEVEENRSGADVLQSTDVAVETEELKEATKDYGDDDMEVDNGESVVDKSEEAVPVEEVRSADVATEKDGDESVETSVTMDTDNSEKKMTEATTVVSEVEVEIISSASQGHEAEADAVGSIDEDADMKLWASCSGGVATEANERDTRLRDAEVIEEVGQIVNTLVDSVVGLTSETVSIDAESVTMLSSPMMPYLSADEAMELLEAHQGDDHELKLDHDDGTHADVEAQPTGNSEYQWFDGGDDDDEVISLIPSSALEDSDETTDDVFGFGGVVDLVGVTPSVRENADIEVSDGSGDTQVIPGNSSSSSSSSSGSSSYSSSSSSSATSASEDESVGRASKKRRVSASNGARKLLKYKKQKRVRSSKQENSAQRRYKRKRKIPPPVIPREFEIFDTEAADPILKGSYAVRNNRRACYVGNWGFSEDAFLNIESISPFEYTSRTRVLQSRRKDDKRPVSGKYGGFFKLRQFNGTLVKIREDQVDLQFLPMPPSDEEDGDEDMEGYDSDEDDGDEPAATRYTVLGKGKNRFGRFLIRGYLNPESGRLTVKRRYLE